MYIWEHASISASTLTLAFTDRSLFLNSIINSYLRKKVQINPYTQAQTHSMLIQAARDHTEQGFWETFLLEELKFSVSTENERIWCKLNGLN